VKARERIAVLAALNLASRNAPAKAADDADAAVQIDTMIARIDNALGHDGHLL
jgi:hypothetical protein